jgi:Methyltransferase domain
MASMLKAAAKKAAGKLSSMGSQFRTCMRFRSIPHPPGHFYSPIPDLRDVKAREKDIWRREAAKEIPGIDLNEQAQLELLDRLKAYYAEQPFTEEPTPHRRYYFANDFFGFCDATIYYCMLRHLKPKRVIEIGSGFSSSVLLDTNDLFFDSSIRCTFIEPYPERLYSLMGPADGDKIQVISRPLQDIDVDCFRELSPGDILFVDSSHVSKVGSDVNMILFEVIPALAPGVHIHFHDVFYPFEYPREWVYRRWAWNELYILKAFLSHNRDFSISLFPSFLELFHPERLRNALPLAQRHSSAWPTLTGGSLWIERVR